jgi:L-seryl-tRNA(Ser) seleniumtransferase
LKKIRAWQNFAHVCFNVHVNTPPDLPLRRVINAWGTATPWGVSRSDPAVAAAVGGMLQRHVQISELQALVSERLATWSGAQAGCVTHCAAAGITLAVAACMAGVDAQRIAQLPDPGGMADQVLLLRAHAVHYGHALTQAIRLAGARPLLFDSPAELQAGLDRDRTACVLAVESHLAQGSGASLTAALVAMAHAAGKPLVLDGAAQDWRVRELTGSGADLVIMSAQKYLAAPTAGLVLGRADMVQALDAQHGGIGRAMKPTKEAMAGVLAAVAQRSGASRARWLQQQQGKVEQLAAFVATLPGVSLQRESDPQGNGFERLWLSPDPAVAGTDAARWLARLRAGSPAVAVAPHRLQQGCIGLELTGVQEAELPDLCRQLRATLSP